MQVWSKATREILFRCLRSPSRFIFLVDHRIQRTDRLQASAVVIDVDALWRNTAIDIFLLQGDYLQILKEGLMYVRN